MRRTDKEITDRAHIDAIIRDSLVCRLALAKDNVPYLVPVSFGYDGRAIFFHTAATGKKIEHFLANPQVCFEFERNVTLRRHPEIACKWSMNYECVVGFGTIAEITDPAEKETGLNAIMEFYSGTRWPFDPREVAGVRVWRIDIASLTAKQSKPKPALA